LSKTIVSVNVVVDALTAATVVVEILSVTVELSVRVKVYAEAVVAPSTVSLNVAVNTIGSGQNPADDPDVTEDVVSTMVGRVRSNVNDTTADATDGLPARSLTAPVGICNVTVPSLAEFTSRVYVVAVATAK
jgi:hypothetical protein